MALTYEGLFTSRPLGNRYEGSQAVLLAKWKHFNT
jgi:hypothetical protein